jgi:hypothetical protein
VRHANSKRQSTYRFSFLIGGFCVRFGSKADMCSAQAYVR